MTEKLFVVLVVLFFLFDGLPLSAVAVTITKKNNWKVKGQLVDVSDIEIVLLTDSLPEKVAVDDIKTIRWTPYDSHTYISGS